MFQTATHLTPDFIPAPRRVTGEHAATVERADEFVAIEASLLNALKYLQQAQDQTNGLSWLMDAKELKDYNETSLEEARKQIGDMLSNVQGMLQSIEADLPEEFQRH